MAEYLRLRLTHTVRSVAVTVSGRVLAGLVAGIGLAAAVQLALLGRNVEGALAPGAPMSERLEAQVGYAVLLLGALSLVTGPHSSRFPCTPADVAWVYASPVPTGHIVLAQLVWQAARRCVFWVLGSVTADVAAAAALDSHPGVFISRAVLATPLLVALTVLSVGAGSTRGSKAPARIAMGLGGGFAVWVLAPLLVGLLAEPTPADALDRSTFTPLARSLGAVLFGQYDVAAAAALAAMALIGGALCWSGGAGLREQLTLDAAFWAEFTMTSTRAGVDDAKPSFRRLSGLVGPWSILWFEVAVLRRSNYQRSSFLLLLVGAVLTGAFAAELVPLFSFAAPVGLVTGAYLSGVGRHLRLRTLLLVPGGLAWRVVAAEALHVALACAGLTMSVVVGGAAGGYDGLEVAAFVAQGAVLLVFAFVIRVAAAGLAFRDGTLAAGPYHLTLTVTAAAGAAVVVALAWLASELGASTPAALAAMLGTASLLSGWALRLFEARVGPGRAGGNGDARGGAPYRSVSSTT